MRDGEGFSAQVPEIRNQKVGSAMGFKVGDIVGVVCDVKPGPFSDEQMVTIETIDGAISGFVRESELRKSGLQWLVRGRVQGVSADALEVWIRGSFLTTNGIASVPQHLAMAA